MADFQALKKNYTNSQSLEVLRKDLVILCDKYRDCIGVGDLLINVGEQLYESGDSNAAFVVINAAVINFEKLISNTTGAYLRIAEHCFEAGDTEKGTLYLVKLCSSTDNYEESVANSGLSHI